MRKNSKIIIIIYFFVLLCIGLSIFRDYGVHWDEYNNQSLGNKWRKYISDVINEQSVTTVLTSLHEEHDWIHGPAFEIFLNFIQNKFFNPDELRNIIFIRHLCTFLLFYISIYFFYLLCQIHFKSWKISLFASAFLILSPRIFADSFYNTVDMPFFSFYIISIYTLLRWLDKKTFPRAIAHAFSCAFLIDIRIVGITVPFYTLVLLIPDIIRTTEYKERMKTCKTVLVYFLLLIVLIILFWPLLWDNTLSKLIKLAKVMNDVHWSDTCLYLGKYITAKNLPWHYAPVWIMITTPIFYSLCFFVGFFISITPFSRNPIISAFNKRNNLLFALWLFVPLIATHGRLYDGWRHIYFVYPAFLMFSAMGLVAIWEFIKHKFKNNICKFMCGLIILVTLLSMGNVIYFMVKYHPYQNIYFNRLAGKNMEKIKKTFEMDYWGLSYRKALEFILENDNNKTIKVFVENVPGKNTANILTNNYKERLVYVDTPGEAKYFLSNYRWHPEEYPYHQEYFSIKIDDAKIMVVYKLQ